MLTPGILSAEQRRPANCDVKSRSRSLREKLIGAGSKSTKQGLLTFVSRRPNNGDESICTSGFGRSRGSMNRGEACEKLLRALRSILIRSGTLCKASHGLCLDLIGDAKQKT